MHHQIRGYTIYEILISLTLIIVIVGISLPLLDKTAARNHQRVELNTLFRAIHLARKESILKRRVVSICPTVDFRQCGSSDDWSFGWIMFENTDRDSPPRVDAGENILKRHQVAENIDISANRRAFTLRATFLRATNGTFVVCDRADRVSPKALVVSYTGRPRVADHTTKGELYSCAD